VTQSGGEEERILGHDDFQVGPANDINPT
jgi:hypothetical protein